MKKLLVAAALGVSLVTAPMVAQAGAKEQLEMVHAYYQHDRTIDSLANGVAIGAYLLYNQGVAQTGKKCTLEPEVLDKIIDNAAAAVMQHDGNWAFMNTIVLTVDIVCGEQTGILFNGRLTDGE